MTIAEIYIGDHINDPSIRLLGQAFILATVSRFHVKERNVKALRRDGGETAIRVSQDKVSIRLKLCQQLIRPAEDIPTGDAEVFTNNRHKNVGANLAVSIVQLEIFPEYRT